MNLEDGGEQRAARLDVGYAISFPRGITGETLERGDPVVQSSGRDNVFREVVLDHI